MFCISPLKVIGDIGMKAAGFFLESYSALWLMYRVVAVIERQGAYSEILRLIGGMAAVYAVYYALGKLYENMYRDACAVEVQAGFQRKLFDCAARVDLGYFDDPAFYSRYNQAVFCSEKAVFQVFDGVVNLVAFSVMLVNTLVFLFTIDGWLMLFGLMSVTAIRIGRHYGLLRAERQKELNEQERRQHYVRQVYTQREYAPDIRVTNVSRVLDNMFVHASRQKEAIIEKSGKKLTCLSFLNTFLSVDGIEILCYVYAAIRIIFVGGMKVAELAVLFSAVIQYASRLRRVITILTDAHEKSQYVDAFRDFLSYKPEITGEVACDEEFDCLEVRNLTFGYDKKPVLDGVSFTIHRGEKVAVVGTNGAGKSTLVKLIMRLYDPDQGEILLNGRNIRVFDPLSYRRHFAYIQQDFQVYDMSVMENVLMREANSDDEPLVREALSFAGVLERVEEAGGVAAQVGRQFDQSGMELSGGQKQALAIARLKARPFDLCIMDEPSAALDPIAEMTFFERMYEAMVGKTTLFISHRLASVRNVDLILMFDQGKLVESGTHDELMRLGGSYARLFDAQASYYRREREEPL